MELPEETNLDQEQQRQKARERLQRFDQQVVQVLANYGDTLSIVEPNESVTVILKGPTFTEDGHTTRVVSVRRSTISEYKASRLSLAQFDQQVLRHDQ